MNDHLATTPALATLPSTDELIQLGHEAAAHHRALLAELRRIRDDTRHLRDCRRLLAADVTHFVALGRDALDRSRAEVDRLTRAMVL